LNIASALRREGRKVLILAEGERIRGGERQKNAVSGRGSQGAPRMAVSTRRLIVWEFFEHAGRETPWLSSEGGRVN